MQEQGTQLFQVITVDGETLSFEASTATAEFCDAFELTKQTGKPNVPRAAHTLRCFGTPAPEVKPRRTGMRRPLGSFR